MPKHEEEKTKDENGKNAAINLTTEANRTLNTSTELKMKF